MKSSSSFEGTGCLDGALTAGFAGAVTAGAGAGFSGLAGDDESSNGSAEDPLFAIRGAWDTEAVWARFLVVELFAMAMDPFETRAKATKKEGRAPKVLIGAPLVGAGRLRQGTMEITEKAKKYTNEIADARQ